jgi:SnoaL-like protein
MNKGVGSCAENRSGEELLVAQLLAAVGGDASRNAVVHLLAPDVICHMDQFTARGPAAWSDWVAFIRSRGVENVRVEVERLETGADGIITAYGGLIAGPEGRPAPRGGNARYRVKNGRIAEIWTSRSNYEVVFGSKVHRPLSWMFVLLWMAIWRRLPWKRPAM